MIEAAPFLTAFLTILFGSIARGLASYFSRNHFESLSAEPRVSELDSDLPREFRTKPKSVARDFSPFDVSEIAMVYSKNGDGATALSSAVTFALSAGLSTGLSGIADYWVPLAGIIVGLVVAGAIWRAPFDRYPSRSVLGFSLVTLVLAGINLAVFVLLVAFGSHAAMPVPPLPTSGSPTPSVTSTP